MLNFKKFFGFDIYLSELDQFLNEFNQNQVKLSDSQQQEVSKYQRIYQLRDNVTDEKLNDNKLWDKF